MSPSTTLEDRLRVELHSAASHASSAPFPKAAVRRAVRVRQTRMAAGYGLAILAVVGLVGVAAVTISDDSPNRRVTTVAAAGGSGGYAPLRQVRLRGDLAALQRPLLVPIPGGLFISGAPGVIRRSDSEPAEPLGTTTSAIVDIETGAVRTVAPSPVPSRRSAATAWTGRAIVIAGGTDGSRVLDDVVAYTPDTDSWKAWPSLPESLTSATAVAVGPAVFVGGGSSPKGPDRTVYSGDGASPWRTIEVGHPVTGLVRGLGGVVAYGFDNQTASLVASRIDRSGRVERLPGLALPADVVSGFALAGDPTSLVFVGELDTVHQMWRYDDGSWSLLRTLDLPTATLPGNRLSPDPAPQPMLDAGRLWTASPEGLLGLPVGRDAGAGTGVGPLALKDVGQLGLGFRCREGGVAALDRSMTALWRDSACESAGLWTSTRIP